MKKLFLLAFVLVFVLVGCQSETEAPTTTETTNVTDVEKDKADDTNQDEPVVEEATTSQLELTLDELAAFNGKNGQPAYVAVDGIIYDMTNSPLWKEGQHNGFEAGADLTTIIKEKSPHGVGKLEKVPAVGILVEPK